MTNPDNLIMAIKKQLSWHTLRQIPCSITALASHFDAATVLSSSTRILKIINDDSFENGHSPPD